jgi:phosphoserine phosphatase
MVGDGATDMEARLEGAADLFIGYGGVVERKNIAEKADVSAYPSVKSHLLSCLL